MKFFFYFVLGAIGAVILLPILGPIIGGVIAFIGAVLGFLMALKALVVAVFTVLGTFLQSPAGQLAQKAGEELLKHK